MTHRYNNGTKWSEAIDKLKNINVDLILMDFKNTPVMDGYEASQISPWFSIKRHFTLIALTALLWEKDLKKVSQFGLMGI